MAQSYPKLKLSPTSKMIVTTSAGKYLLEEIDGFLYIDGIKLPVTGQPPSIKIDPELIGGVKMSDGSIQWHDKQGRPHRDGDKPAIIRKDGSKEWHQHGRLHRDGDLPAFEYHNEAKFWYQNGEHHRDNDLPASIYANGDKYWYQRGKLHRESDKPAVMIYKDSKLIYTAYYIVDELISEVGIRPS